MKQVRVILDPETSTFEVDNSGMKGQGCAAVLAKIVEGNVLVEDKKKPEYFQKNEALVCQ